MDAAQSGTQLALGCTAVEPDVEGAGKRGGYPKALRQTGSVEPVALGDENTKAVTTHGVGTCKVVHAARVGGGQLQQGGGWVTHMHRAADVVGEQGSGSAAGREVAYKTYMLGLDAADDQ